MVSSARFIILSKTATKTERLKVIKNYYNKLFFCVRV